MALERSSDMEGLSPSERAALYKQRAAAAGIGRPPNAGAEKEAPAARPAPPTQVSAPAQAPSAATAVQERPASTAVPAKVAAAAAVRRDQVAAVARRATPPSSQEQSERLVYVWPHLVTIEFLSAMLLLVTMVVIGIVLQAPLESHANLDKTPNPSKAPWYFLNLQELLLHMHPALAGVLIPGGVVFAAIPLIPYIDRNTADVGKWFGTRSARSICWFTTIYTLVVEIAELLFDAFLPIKELTKSWTQATGIALLSDPSPLGIGALSIPNVLIPTIFMVAPIILLMFIVKWFFKPEGIRDYLFALFTGFVVTYTLLTIVGSFFRGQGMVLYWPWDPHMVRLD